MESFYYLKVILFVLVTLSFTGFFYQLKTKDIIKNKLKKAYKALDEAASERVRTEKKNILLDEEDINKTFLERALVKPNKLFIYSGLEHSLGVTFEIWFIMGLAGAAVLYFAVHAATGSFSAGCITAIVFVAALYLMELMLSIRNYRIVEDNLIKFLNLLNNYSITVGEITVVFQQISRYLPDPLGYVLEECYYDVHISGDLSSALYYMIEKIEHPDFRELIRNIEICSNYSADYTEIISNSRKIIQEEQKAKNERKSIANEYIVNMVLIGSMLLISFVIVERLIQVSVTDIILHTAIGRGCIAIAMAIYVFFVFKILTLKR